MNSVERQRKNWSDRPFHALTGADRLTAIFGDGPHACVKCGAAERLEVDHINPKMKGGKHLRSNLQILCADCHRRKTLIDLGGTESAPCAIVIGPNRYRSVHAAERATGIDRKTIRKHRNAGTLDDLIGYKFARRSGTAIETHYRGAIYPSRQAVIVQCGIGNSRLERDLHYGSVAWDFKTYRKSRRWTSLERHMHDGGERQCGFCGGAATRLMHVEPWTDLMLRPFDLETFAVCGRCRRREEAGR